VMSCTKKNYDDLKSENFFGLTKIKTKPTVFNSWKDKIQKFSPISQGRIIAAPVSFTAMAFPTVPYVHPSNAALSIAAEIMENRVLHKRIREQGGAYGGGASHMNSWGYFYFYSYRDPHLKSTLEAFKEAVDVVCEGSFDERNLEEAKLQVLQGFDTPTAPENRATTAYNWLQSDRSQKRRQSYREHLLSLTKEDIQKAALDILLPGMNKHSTIVTFGGNDLLTKENMLLKDKALPLFSTQGKE
jgi:presequence protease